MTTKNGKNVSSAFNLTPFETDAWPLNRDLLDSGSIDQSLRHCAKQGGEFQGMRAPYKRGCIQKPTINGDEIVDLRSVNEKRITSNFIERILHFGYSCLFIQRYTFRKYEDIVGS